MFLWRNCPVCAFWVDFYMQHIMGKWKAQVTTFSWNFTCKNEGLKLSKHLKWQLEIRKNYRVFFWKNCPVCALLRCFKASKRPLSSRATSSMNLRFFQAYFLAKKRSHFAVFWSVPFQELGSLLIQGLLCSKQNGKKTVKNLFANLNSWPFLKTLNSDFSTWKSGNYFLMRQFMFIFFHLPISY